MNFIEIKDYFIDLNKVNYIDFRYDDEDDEYTVLFQFDSVDNYILLSFVDYYEYKYWLDLLRKKINC